MDDPGQPFSPGEGGQTYAEDRRKRLHRQRVVGYAVCVALWLLSAVPLARLSSNEGGGAGVAVAFLAGGLAIAIVARGVYARWTRRSLWSPWLFVIAAVLALAGYAVRSAGPGGLISARAIEGRELPRGHSAAQPLAFLAGRTYRL